MSSTYNAKKALLQRELKNEPRREFVKAKLVEVEGSVDVLGRPSYVWCQEYGEESSIFQALNLSVQRTPNLPVIVGWTLRPPYQRQVMEVDRDVTEAENYNQENPYLINHSLTHQYFSEDEKGADAVLIGQPALQMFKAIPSGSDLLLTLNGLYYLYEDTFISKPIETIDLTPYLPTVSGTTKSILVYLNVNNGAIEVSEGTAVISTVTPTKPGIEPFSIPSCYVNLTYGQTTLTEVEDCRLFLNRYTTDNHNDLLNLQGGEANEYYHLTEEQYLANQSSAAGIYTFPTITNNEDGTYAVGDFVCKLFSSADGAGEIQVYSITGDTFTPIENANNYLVVNYNSGNPILQNLTSNSTINCTTIIPVAFIYLIGTTIDIVAMSETAKAVPNKLHKRAIKLDGYVRETGFTLSERATRLIDISAGTYWYGASQISLPAFATGESGNVLREWVYDGSVWTPTIVTQYNNTEYQGETGKITSNGNKYLVLWVYRKVSTYDSLGIVAGYILSTQDYTKLEDAKNSQLPTVIPPIFQTFGMLVGRIIIKYEATSATEIAQTYTHVFTQSPTNLHNELSGLDGGESGLYNHYGTLTEATIPIADASGLLVDSGVTFDGVSLSVNGTEIGAGGVYNAGISWEAREQAADDAWVSVCFGENIFAAIANSGAGSRLMTSYNGINWTTRTNPDSTQDWTSICYGNGIFVAVSETTSPSNQSLKSSDGRTWYSYPLDGTPSQWKSVCYGGGLFVAVGHGPFYYVMTSSDGISWTYISGISPFYWESVCYGDGLFVAVARDGTGDRVMTSLDGINWTSQTAPTNAWRSVCYGNGTYVAVAHDNVMTSPDGINWTLQTSIPENSWMSVCYSNGLYVAVSLDGTGNRVMTSPDGVVWTSRVSAVDSPWWSVVYGNGLLVAVAPTGTYRVMTSGTVGVASYTHPTGDGNLHVPATGTTNAGRVLTAGDEAGELTWETPTIGTVTEVTGTSPIGVETGTTTPVISMAAASAGVDGYMTGVYATKLDGIAEGATANPVFTRGDILRGGAVGWEAYSALTTGAVLVGDGTDIVSTINPYIAGSLGIGIAIPLTSLHVVSSTGIRLDSTATLPMNVNRISAYASNGGVFYSATIDDGATLPVAGSRIGGFNLAVRVTGGTASAALWSAFAETNHSDTDRGVYMAWETIAAGTIIRSEKMRLTSAGYLGIGTNSPRGLFHAKLSANYDLLTTADAFTIVRKSAAIASSTTLGRLQFVGTEDSYATSFVGSEIRGSGDGTWTATSSPGRIDFYTTPAGSTAQVEVGRFTASGNLLIGTTTDTSGKLQVSGSAVVSSRLTVGTVTESSNILLKVNGSVTSTGDAYGQYVGINLTPANTKAAYFSYINGGVVSDNTTAYAFGQYIDGLYKSGAGTVTNAYGLYVKHPTIGTNNYTAYFETSVGIGTTPSNLAALVASRIFTDTTGTYYGASIVGYLNPASASSASVVGFLGTARTTSANAQNVTSLYGVTSSAIHQGSGTVTALVGLSTSVSAIYAGGTVTAGYGIIVEAPTVKQTAITAAITTYYGISVKGVPTTSYGTTITTTYGLIIGDMTAGSTNYAIYTGLGAVRFGGEVTCASTINVITNYQLNGVTALSTGVVNLGSGNTVSGALMASAIGYYCKATGGNSLATGYYCEASSDRGIAMGSSSKATEALGIAIGAECVASGIRSMVLGSKANANGKKACFVWSDEVGCSAPDNSTFSVQATNGAFFSNYVSAVSGYKVNATTFIDSTSFSINLINATAPTVHTDNSIQIFSTDTGDATATLGLLLEQQIEAIGTFTASHKIKVNINGANYWLQLDAV